MYTITYFYGDSVPENIQFVHDTEKAETIARELMRAGFSVRVKLHGHIIASNIPGDEITWPTARG